MVDRVSLPVPPNMVIDEPPTFDMVSLPVPPTIMTVEPVLASESLPPNRQPA